MKPWTARRLLVTLLISALVWAVPAAACLLVGTGGFGWPGRDAFSFRLDVVLLASLVGAALSAAGVVYQAILRNPLAEPYLLGVSSGAMLFSYLWHLPWMTRLVMLGSGRDAVGEQVFAFVGAMLAVGIVFVLATRGGRLEPVTLLLVGVIVNAVNGSIFLLINALVKDPAAQGGPLRFLVGGLQTSLALRDLVPAVVVIGIGWIVLLLLSGHLNAALLSEAEAQSLGVRIHRLRWVALTLASLVTASAVAVSGPIGFIGLVCPHVARLIVRNDQRRLLPLATALGAGLLAVADAIARGLARTSTIETILPVGVLTGLLGGPFFLFLLWRNRKRAMALEAGQ